MSQSKWYIHVNQPLIRSHLKAGTDGPVVRYQKGKNGKSRLVRRLKFKDGVIIQSLHGKPVLKCGARVVIECVEEPEVIEP